MKFITPDVLPPILPDVEQQLREYIICPERLPIHQYENNQEFWPCEQDISSLFETERSPLSTTLTVQRDHMTGKIIEFREVPIPGAGTTAKNSLSLNRAPAPHTDSVRGDPSFFPFWPGGIPVPKIDISTEELAADFKELLTVPPGFSEGLIFEADGCTVVSKENIGKTQPSTIQREEEDDDKIVNLMELVHKEQDLLGLWNETNNILESTISFPSMPKLEVDDADVLPKEQDILVLKISEHKRVLDNKWAVMLDVTKPVTDFHERIPELAHNYPFELDTFQKQAILKLEEDCDVFVAAHTSAGKTVVAEYAIALSQKHKTRTIYTSPIKALSNQKYRDFKHTFQDVGLVTGDFQINQTGVCLIMTTEILRSMLFGGSEVIRDLEYVIFDEVHYINDAERGHVWEEVLILLPSHVRIVLLSATVPNTLEFATWLGQIKQRKVYVISTLQRPVPLQHYLYTGTGGESKDEKFLILNAKGNFDLEKHREATAILNKRREAGKSKYVSGGKKMSQDATAWSSLIDHLSKNDLLPVVVFTFSRAQCDKSAELIKRDLTTGKEKSKIHSFFQQCIGRLKKPDQKLPQIIQMQNTLKNGIGVHHSGILPIVKEIVEMLFQNGLVKILFATETFAMGVNMPARTVIFNGITKFDGVASRFLKPAEYIQMAGRAGRRGLDKTGTVIIRCIENVPDTMVLKNMMMGRPQKLQSQFRLTYGMLLSLLRVESLTIESVMTHSFREVNHVSQADQLKVELIQAEKDLAAESSKELSDQLQNLVKYYTAASDYMKQFNITQPKILQQMKVVKDMTPGRVILISHKEHFKKLAVLLKVNTKKELLYTVLVLADQKKISDEVNFLLLETKSEAKQPKIDEVWFKMLSYATEEIYQPKGVGGHEVLEITSTDILELTSKVIKVDTELVINDWEKRQIPRFRNDPPGKTCHQAIQELTKITSSVFSESGIQFLTTSDFHIKDINLMEEIIELQRKKKELDMHLNYTRIANFTEQFANVYKRKHLEEKVEMLNFLISHRSLSLYPEYLCRIEVLREMKYIHDQNRVEMKGQIACIMGMNELLLTELIFRNTLADLDACEVAALLSALVFQAKSSIEPQLSETLIKGQKEIEAINDEIQRLEHYHHIQSNEGSKHSNLNFKLVQVVYEWAKEKPFAEIMLLTDVQEGIIVRCIQQLNEILKDVKDAAGRIGDPVLQHKMEDASNAIKRDIVFAASLYTQREAANIGV